MGIRWDRTSSVGWVETAVRCLQMGLMGGDWCVGDGKKFHDTGVGGDDFHY